MAINRFIQLARVFIEGRGIPFLGAGISMQAKVPTGATWKPTVGWMVNQLLEEIFNKLQNNPQVAEQLGAFLGLSQEEYSRDPFSDDFRGALAGRVGGRLGDLCQAATSLNLLTMEEVVRCLCIDKYVLLRPTMAHYFISFLVRETLVNEAITTNYDCCLEHALHHCRGGRYTEPGYSGNQHPPVVSITDLAEYRKYGARRLAPGRNTVVLRLYKINGCSARLNGDGARSRILLTRQQLRDMDDRAWARDLLRDRARSRVLVFSGFGSDEPQIQFTLERLLEEFIRDGVNVTSSNIWINVYEKQPSQSQQLLLSSQSGHSGSYEEYYISARDRDQVAEYLDEKITENRLSADLFWQTLFQVVFLALLERYTRPGTAGWHFLSAIDMPGRPVQRKRLLEQWLDPAGLGGTVLQGGILPVNKSNKCLQRVNTLLGYWQNTQDAQWMPRSGVPLCLWLRALHEVPMPPGGDDLAETYYRPLTRNPLSVLLLLSFYCFCGSRDEPPFVVTVNKGTGMLPRLYLRLGSLRIRLLSGLSMGRICRNAGELESVNVLVGYQYITEISNRIEDPLYFVTEQKQIIQVRRITPVPASILVSVCSSFQDNDGDENGPENFQWRIMERMVEQRRWQAAGRTLFRARLRRTGN